MTMKPSRRWVGVVGIVVTIFGVLPLSSAQSTKTEPSPGTADLLSEVRGLRSELNQFATASIRVQLFMGRLQLQEHRIQTLSQQIVDTRAELEKTRVDLLRSQADLDEFNRGEHPIQLQRGDPNHERIVRITGEEINTNVIRLQTHMQSLIAQDAEWSQQLAIEQGRWSDFNARLDALDAALPIARQ